MVTPAETLVVMIEAAAALAGIVVALRRDSWTACRFAIFFPALSARSMFWWVSR